MNEQRLFGPGRSLANPASFAIVAAQPRTALPVLEKVPQHLEAHLQRLMAGASALEQPMDWLLSVRAELEAWLEAVIPEGDAALRLVLHPATQVLSARLEPLPRAPQPYSLALLPHPLGERQMDPQITHKGLAGPWGVDILASARRLGAEDALLVWPDGSLAETAIAAVGIESGTVLTLPPFQGRVTSLAERLMLPEWAASRGLRIERAEVSPAQARQGRIWCLNALRGIWPAALL